MIIENIQYDGNQLIAKQKESLEKRSRMLKQWVAGNNSTITN